ncbi:MAG TPA: class I SAM-dependent methyltransferase [Bryobacteraceae bacterium]|nr:class I SAM-dependent methyltransferase [Bryobacteraceae bacterium]
MPASPSWYLDPLVAKQKREVHQQWIRDLLGSRPRDLILKTDLFEEAYGLDRILDDLFPEARLAVGIDLNLNTVRAAASRDGSRFVPAASDVRHLPFRPASVDVVVSTSTLDHFESRAELAASIDELARILRPGGTLFITLDNPRNPLYHLLRWASRRGWTPFRLGQTISLSALARMLEARGFVIENTEYLIHNPRLISTILFLSLRKAFGRRADVPVQALLKLFAAGGYLPIRAFTACFVAVCAIKPECPRSR